MEEYYFISFENTTSALKAEELLKKNEIKINVIPTPREVSQSCGLSIRFGKENLEKVKEIVGDGTIRVKGIYLLKKQDNGRTIVKAG